MSVSCQLKELAGSASVTGGWWFGASTFFAAASFQQRSNLQPTGHRSQNKKFLAKNKTDSRGHHCRAQLRLDTHGVQPAAFFAGPFTLLWSCDKL